MKRSNVMIVDDTPANIEVVSESLGDDYEMVFATSGAEALDLIREDKPDLILLGHHDARDGRLRGLPHPQGGIPATRDIPIIFVTAMTRKRTRSRGWSLAPSTTSPSRSPRTWSGRGSRTTWR